MTMPNNCTYDVTYLDEGVRMTWGTYGSKADAIAARAELTSYGVECGIQANFPRCGGGY